MAGSSNRRGALASAAARDLGIIAPSPTEVALSLEAFELEVCRLLILGCASHGRSETLQVFAKILTAGRKAFPSRSRPRLKHAPPQKRLGAHNPVDDRLLVQLWKVTGGSKEEFARMACKNHPTVISPRSLVRKLNRLLAGGT